MKVSTSELTGAALDWAVAKCEGVRTVLARYEHTMTGVCVLDAELVEMATDGPQELRYSRDWAQGGPIIEREEVHLLRLVGGWVASIAYSSKDGKRLVGWRRLASAPTPLVAAMRAYVASKLGDEIDVPEELT